MTKRWLVCLAIAAALGGVLSTESRATSVSYVSCCAYWAGGSFANTGYTSGWTQNQIGWSDPEGGTPNMGSAYYDSGGNILKPFIWSGSKYIDDLRYVSNYASALCKASGSNQKLVYVSFCIADHN